ncbi:MAG: hypothetical protein IPL10_05945 [Bacteroidetes bacterium]|jgi:hypothetical protein|nr:hypothetical protein [Bacteroidota bacterium]
MKKLITVLSVLALSLTISSCGDKGATQNIEAPAGMVALDLSKFGKQFSIFVPDTTAAKLEVVEQSWGALEIKVGKNFHISVTEDPGDIELRKSDIKSNDVNIFKSFVVEEPLTIMWESAITKPEYHFYTIKKIGNNNYVFEDVVPTDGEPLGKEAIQKMYDSAKNIIEKAAPDA